MLFRRAALAVFVYGFAKSARDNIGPEELKAFRSLAEQTLSLSEAQLAVAMSNGTLREIRDHG